MHLSLKGKFRDVYRLLKRHHLLDTTPVILCEGDSWFSTPLSMNLIDQLVFATPEEEAAGKVFFGKGGLFFRAEKSGDRALNMFTEKNVNKLSKWYKAFDFDLVLLSAGGNDFVDEFLKKLFKNKPVITVQQAVQLVIDSGQYDKVLAAYRVFINKFISEKPHIPIIAHTYDYPVLLGKPANLTLSNIGLIALFKKKVGDWISNHVEDSLPNLNDQVEFAKQLIDNFESRILSPLAIEFNNNFSYVDLRNTLTEDLWFDEMHPSGLGFHKLAQKLKKPISDTLPVNKKT
jgi:hypothetical protein